MDDDDSNKKRRRPVGAFAASSSYSCEALMVLGCGLVALTLYVGSGTFTSAFVRNVLRIHAPDSSPLPLLTPLATASPHGRNRSQCNVRNSDHHHDRHQVDHTFAYFPSINAFCAGPDLTPNTYTHILSLTLSPSHSLSLSLSLSLSHSLLPSFIATGAAKGVCIFDISALLSSVDFTMYPGAYAAQRRCLSSGFEVAVVSPTKVQRHMYTAHDFHSHSPPPVRAPLSRSQGRFPL